MENAATTVDLSAFLTTIGEGVTWLFNEVGNVADAVTGNPMLLTSFSIMIAGAAIGLFSRLIRTV